MYYPIPPSYPPYPSHMQPLPGAVGDLYFDHEWPVQITHVRATGWSEKVLAVGLLGIAAVVAYKKLS